MRYRPLARILPVVALLALMLLPFQSALADAEHNAALRYWRGMSLLSPELEETVKAIRIDKRLNDPAWTPDDDQRELISQNAQSVIHEFIKAGRLPECDFGNDIEEGIELLLPHLGGLRTGAVLLLIDGRIKLADGDPQAAADRFAAVYALAAHCASDDFLVSSLVSVSIIVMANDTIAHESMMANLGASGRKTMNLAAWRFESEDPFHLQRAIESEGEMMMSWLREQFSEPISESQLKTLMEAWFDSAVETEELMKVVSDPEALESALVRMQLWYTQSAADWNKPDAQALLDAMDAQFRSTTKDHPYGLLTEFFGPSVSRAKKNELRGIGALDRARAMTSQ